MARNGCTKVIYKGTFISKQTLESMKLSYLVYNESLALEDFSGAVFTCANFQKIVQMGFSLNGELGLPR